MDRLQHNPRAVIRTRAKLNYDMVRGPKADTKPCEAIIPGLSQIGRVNDFLTAIGFVYSIYILYIYNSYIIHPRSPKALANLKTSTSTNRTSRNEEIRIMIGTGHISPIPWKSRTIEDYQNNSHRFWMIKIPYLKIVFGENLLCNWSITQASKVDSFLTSNEKSIPALLCRLDLECST